MIVTTSLGMDEGLVYRARRIASELGIEYKERKKQSVGKMLGTYEAVLVLYKDKLILEQRGGRFYFSTQILPCCGLSLEEIRF